MVFIRTVADIFPFPVDQGFSDTILASGYVEFRSISDDPSRTLSKIENLSGYQPHRLNSRQPGSFPLAVRLIDAALFGPPLLTLIPSPPAILVSNYSTGFVGTVPICQKGPCLCMQVSEHPSTHGYHWEVFTMLSRLGDLVCLGEKVRHT